jgi:hypothetical protein
MCLTAAFFRSAGFPPNQAIDRETRSRRMTEARRLTNAEGAPLMNSDPHPLVGWARFLEWHRCASALAVQEMRRLKDAVRWAESAYKHWRPELRYKIREVRPNELGEMRRAASWFLDNAGRL